MHPSTPTVLLSAVVTVLVLGVAQWYRRGTEEDRYYEAKMKQGVDAGSAEALAAIALPTFGSGWARLSPLKTVWGNRKDPGHPSPRSVDWAAVLAASRVAAPLAGVGAAWAVGAGHLWLALLAASAVLGVAGLLAFTGAGLGICWGAGLLLLACALPVWPDPLRAAAACAVTWAAASCFVVRTVALALREVTGSGGWTKDLENRWARLLGPGTQWGVAAFDLAVGLPACGIALVLML